MRHAGRIGHGVFAAFECFERHPGSEFGSSNLSSRSRIARHAQNEHIRSASPPKRKSRAYLEISVQCPTTAIGPHCIRSPVGVTER